MNECKIDNGICMYCGEEFTIRYKGKTNKCCSYRCDKRLHHELKGYKFIGKKCLACNIIFAARDVKSERDLKYCCQMCAVKSPDIYIMNKICEICGENFSCKSSRNYRTCSKGCYNSVRAKINPIRNESLEDKNCRLHKCIHCGEMKTYDSFYKDKKASNGIRSHCKDCNYIRLSKINYPPIMTGTLICKLCGQEKSVLEFGVCKGSKIGRIQSCKKCYYDKQWAKECADKKLMLKKALRSRIRQALNGTNKSQRTMELIGCTIEELIIHLESQFTEGMTWENNTNFGWHVDHILPCAGFDLTDPEQQKICFNYKNLQPLWWRENLSKNDLSPEEYEKRKSTRPDNNLDI